jgi:putative phosphoesterase
MYVPGYTVVIIVTMVRNYPIIQACQCIPSWEITIITVQVQRLRNVRSVHVGGVTFVVIHGSQWYGERREKKLLELAKEYDAQVVVFGHTHRRYLRQYNDITIMNPGSIGLPRDGKHGTFAIVSIEEGTIQDIEFKEL